MKNLPVLFFLVVIGNGTTQIPVDIRSQESAVVRILGGVNIFSNTVGLFSRSSQTLGEAFDETVSKYFKENFGAGGIQYLKSLKARLRYLNYGDIFRAGNTSYLVGEVEKIFSGKRGLNNIRFRIHRFLGILDSVASRLSIKSITKESDDNIWSILFDQSLDYHVAFPQSIDRKILNHFIEIIKVSLFDGYGSVSPIVVDYCLRLIGFLPFKFVNDEEFARLQDEIRAAIDAISKYKSVFDDADASFSNQWLLNQYFLKFSVPARRSNFSKKIRILMKVFNLLKAGVDLKCPQFDIISSKARTVIGSGIEDFFLWLGPECGELCCNNSRPRGILANLEFLLCPGACKIELPRSADYPLYESS